MWRKTDDIAARCARLAESLTAAGERDAQIVSAMHRVCDAKQRHADAHECRANESMKVYKRCRQNV
jgi:hypothetical protein